MTKGPMVAYLVPPGTSRCESWGRAVLLATGCVVDGRRLPFAVFLGPPSGAPDTWKRLPPKEQLPGGTPVEIDGGYACALDGGRTAEWVCWDPTDGARLDPEKVSARIAGALAWWAKGGSK